MNKIKRFFIAATAGTIMLSVMAIPVFAVGSNGSFESGISVPFGGAITLNSVDSTSITDWNVVTGDVDYVNGFWQASDGTRSIDLNGFGSGSVSQTLTTIAGATYRVTFDMSGNPGDCIQYPNGGCSPDIKTLLVSATGATSQSFNFNTATAGNTFADMKWTPESFTFVATGTSTTLTFASQIAGAFGPALDNVVIGETLPTPTPVNLPTSKDQCKKDGWKTFGVFKNQGDCVSYVATGGKNLPANL